MTSELSSGERTEADRVRGEIERARQQLVSSVSALQSELAMSIDWRTWVRRRPVFVLAGAFGLGVWFGSRR